MLRLRLAGRLALVLVLAWVGVAAQKMPRLPGRVAVSTVTGGSSTTLTISDLTLDGAFQFPTGAHGDGKSMIFDVGLGYRAVGGVAHVFTHTLGGNVIEWVVPTLKTAGASGSNSYYNDATLYAEWGDVLSNGGAGTRDDTQPDPTPGFASFQLNCAAQDWGGSAGLFWHEAASRIYKTYRADYPQGDASYTACYNGAATATDPYWGYGTLVSKVGTVGTAAGVGTWRTSTWRYKGLSRGLGEVPSAWQSSFGGNRLYLWGGGYSSLLCNPDLDDSAGLSIALFDDTALPITQGNAVTIAVPLSRLGKWCNAGNSETITGLAEARNNLATPSRTGVFDYLDQITGAVMLDNGAKSGLLSFEWVVAGNIQYSNSHLARAGGDSLLRVYKLSDLATVYGAGGTGSNSVTYDTVGRITYPDVDYTGPAMHSGPTVSCASFSGTVGTVDGTATCASHGLNDGEDFYLYGASDSTFNVSYEVISHTMNTLVVQRARSMDFFSSASASGTLTIKPAWGNSPEPMNCCILQTQYQSVAADQVNRKIYVLVPIAFGGYTNASATSWRLVVYRYSY